LRGGRGNPGFFLDPLPPGRSPGPVLAPEWRNKGPTSRTPLWGRGGPPRFSVQWNSLGFLLFGGRRSGPGLCSTANFGGGNLRGVFFPFPSSYAGFWRSGTRGGKEFFRGAFPHVARGGGRARFGPRCWGYATIESWCPGGGGGGGEGGGGRGRPSHGGIGGPSYASATSGPGGGAPLRASWGTFIFGSQRATTEPGWIISRLFCGGRGRAFAGPAVFSFFSSSAWLTSRGARGPGVQGQKRVGSRLVFSANYCPRGGIESFLQGTRFAHGGHRFWTLSGMPRRAMLWRDGVGGPLPGWGPRGAAPKGPRARKPLGPGGGKHPSWGPPCPRGGGRGPALWDPARGNHPKKKPGWAFLGVGGGPATFPGPPSWLGGGRGTGQGAFPSALYIRGGPPISLKRGGGGGLLRRPFLRSGLNPASGPSTTGGAGGDVPQTARESRTGRMGGGAGGALFSTAWMGEPMNQTRLSDPRSRGKRAGRQGSTSPKGNLFFSGGPPPGTPSTFLLGLYFCPAGAPKGGAGPLGFFFLFPFFALAGLHFGLNRWRWCFSVHLTNTIGDIVRGGLGAIQPTVCNALGGKKKGNQKGRQKRDHWIFRMGFLGNRCFLFSLGWEGCRFPRPPQALRGPVSRNGFLRAVSGGRGGGGGGPGLHPVLGGAIPRGQPGHGRGPRVSASRGGAGPLTWGPQPRGPGAQTRFGTRRAWEDFSRIQEKGSTLISAHS